eukprot:182877-Chlamydomonas_euryale.AAC.7
MKQRNRRHTLPPVSPPWCDSITIASPRRSLLTRVRSLPRSTSVTARVQPRQRRPTPLPFCVLSPPCSNGTSATAATLLSSPTRSPSACTLRHAATARVQPRQRRASGVPSGDVAADDERGGLCAQPGAAVVSTCLV